MSDTSLNLDTYCSIFSVSEDLSDNGFQNILQEKKNSAKTKFYI